MARHLVVGKGPIGTTLASTLAQQGHDVVVASRSGGHHRDVEHRNAEHRNVEQPNVEHRAVDVGAPGELRALARAVDVIYNCVNPPYHRWPTVWPPLHEAFLDAAEVNDAVLVTTSNLYGHGAGSGVMREDTPLASAEVKGQVRAEMWRTALERHEAGRVRATEVRAADYFGPLASDAAHYGARLLGPLLAGGTVRPIGDPDVPHAVVYVPDFARALAAAGTTEAAWGRPWLAPHLSAETFREVSRRFAAAAGVTAPRIAPLPSALLTTAALVSPMLREVRRVAYQFTEPFEVDSRLSERELGVRATPWDEAIDATLAWWRAQDGSSRAA